MGGVNKYRFDAHNSGIDLVLNEFAGYLGRGIMRSHGFEMILN